MLRKAAVAFGFALAALPMAVAPAAAQADSAANPFVSQGPFIISMGYGIHPAGNSGRFVVPSRRVFGFFGANGSSSLTAPFMIHFKTNVPIATQAGSVHGTLYVCENAPAPLTADLAVLGCLDMSTVDLAGLANGDPTSLDTASILTSAVSRQGRVALKSGLGAGADVLHPLLNVNGVFTFTGGDTQGNGDVNGFLTLILDPLGHIIGLDKSNLALCGDWTGPSTAASCPFAQ